MFTAVKHKDGKYDSHADSKEIKVFVSGDIVFHAKSINGILDDIEIIKNDLTKESLYFKGADIYLKNSEPIFRMHQWISTEGSHLGVVPCNENVVCVAI